MVCAAGGGVCRSASAAATGTKIGSSENSPSKHFSSSLIQEIMWTNKKKRRGFDRLFVEPFGPCHAISIESPTVNYAPWLNVAQAIFN